MLRHKLLGKNSEPPSCLVPIGVGRIIDLGVCPDPVDVSFQEVDCDVVVAALKPAFNLVKVDWVLQNR